ncbi:response regulator [Thermodesulfobacteriota bacterium]
MIMVRILLVDDEEYILRYYSYELSCEGHDVITLNSGDNLLEKNERYQPDMVIMDIRLFEWDGLDLLKIIKDHYDHLPVIICSAYDTYMDACLKAGAYLCVIKSFNLTGLKNAVSELVNGIDSRFGSKPLPEPAERRHGQKNNIHV